MSLKNKFDPNSHGSEEINNKKRRRKKRGGAKAGDGRRNEEGRGEEISENVRDILDKKKYKPSRSQSSYALPINF